MSSIPSVSRTSTGTPSCTKAEARPMNLLRATSGRRAIGTDGDSRAALIAMAGTDRFVVGRTTSVASHHVQGHVAPTSSPQTR
jgi:hypothetical protein